MPELPENWRDLMVRQVSGKVPASDRLFAGGPVLKPLDQIGIYRQQYRLRLTEAVSEDLLGLRKLVGDDVVEAWVVAFLRDHPSQSWTLNRVSGPFGDWLASRRVPIEQLEMARVDLAVQQGFEAGDGDALGMEDLVGVPSLALAPHVTLLLNQTNAHAVRAALLAGHDRPDTVAEPVHLVLYRQGRAMRHWSMEPAPWRVLSYVQQGRGVMVALEQVVADGLLAPEDVETSVATWFKDFVTDGLLVRG